jgi:hypothetical protein
MSLFSEYLAVFKKTVSSHEVFLQRLSSHPVLSKDRNFHVFLEYDQDVRAILFHLRRPVKMYHCTLYFLGGRKTLKLLKFTSVLETKN